MRVNRRRFMVTSAAAVPLLTGGTACAAGQETGAARSGADVLAGNGWQSLAGRRVAVLTNPTGVLNSLTHIVDDMHAGGSVDLVAVFGPEHGFRGTSQAGGSEGDYADPRTGIPVYDAYGVDADELAQLFNKAGVEQLIFDIADVGVRFYTYIWSMYTAMTAAAKVGAAVTVLDRPNPIGGRRVVGPVLDPDFASGVGMLPIAMQHGMTMGELAKLFDEQHLAEPLREVLEVVRAEGWIERSADAGLPWVPPSPNMPTPDTAMVYPGTGLFEGTVLSEGRGTTRPFEFIGAPGIDWRWAEELNGAGMDGVRFRETYFVPTFSKHADKTCGGVQIHRTGDVDAVRMAVTMLVTARRLYPDVFGWRPDHMIDKLSGSDRLRKMIDAGASTDEIIDSWHEELTSFRRLRQRYLLYR